MHNIDMFERICPKCGDKIIYQKRGTWYMASRRNSMCQKCYKLNSKGVNNGFYGKHHTNKTKEKIGKYVRSEEQREKLRERIKKYSNKRHPYQIWLEKFGKEEADKKFEELKKKQSNTGNKNGMFGKPSPQGSGNGWSGWYKGYYFRSLLELSYIVNVLEKENLIFENAEQRKYRIEYIDWDGQIRNYFADFLIENKRLIECKPKRLHNSKEVILKAKAAREFCKNNNLEYEIIEPKKLSKEEIVKLYSLGLIKWLPKYEIKYAKG